MAIIGFEIEKCNECPLHRTERTITSDSFEYALDYYCTVNNKVIDEYCESIGELCSVPKWCPLMLKES